MAENMTISGSIPYYDSIRILLDNPECRKSILDTNVKEIHFLEDNVRKCDVDSILDENYDQIVICGIPKSPDNLIGLLTFGWRQVLFKRKTNSQAQWIISGHTKEMNRIVNDFNDEMLKDLQEKGPKQIRFIFNSAIKTLVLEQLEESYRNLIADDLRTGISLDNDDDSLSYVVLHNYWRTKALGSTMFTEIKPKLGEYAENIQKTHHAILEFYRNPTKDNVNNASSGLTKMILCNLGLASTPCKVGGPYY